MTLIKSISGIRGTIGGKPDEGLTPIDIVKYVSAFSHIILEKKKRPKVVVGRDGRISGEIVNRLVTGCLMSCGIDVVDLGLSTTPTVEMAVVFENADGGIILTASHNPKQWNALKLLNERGEFISEEEGEKLLKMDLGRLSYASTKNLGGYTQKEQYGFTHIEKILELDLVEPEAIQKNKFSVVVDAINSTGATFVPMLLKRLGITNIKILNGEITGDFAHNPEPLQENLEQISNYIKTYGADLGIVVDPDVDRLCFLDEKGDMFGEEFTLVAIADYVLEHSKGPAVSNLSSSRALKDICDRHGVDYFASAVGEVNVVKKMKECNAIIGGEGNGGVIIPALHYGRDALVGIALFLSHLAKSSTSVSMLRKKYPNYVMSKNKIQLTPDLDVDDLLNKIAQAFSNQQINTADGVKIDFEKGWLHLRKSNTEPIIRIYAEGETEDVCNHLISLIMEKVNELSSYF